MTPSRPEIRNRRADRGIVLISVRIHVSGVRDLALGSRVDAVDLAGSQRLEEREVQGFGERVDACVFEELVACLVDLGGGGVALEIARVDDLAREVVACV